MSGTSRGGLLRLFSAAVIDQGMLSAASFAVGLLLLRYTSDFDYGHYVLVQSAILLLVAVQGAWVSRPLAVLAPKRTPAEQRGMVGAVEQSQRRVLRGLAAAGLVAASLGALTGLWDGLRAGIVAAGVLAAWAALQREYLRGVLLLYARPQTLLAADTLFVAVLVATALLAVFGPTPAVVWALLGLAAAGCAGAWPARRAIARDPGWSAGEPGPVWRQLRPLGAWAVTGSATYWIMSQSYNYILAARLDIVAVADVNAARLLLMPTVVLTTGVKGLLTPSAARWLRESGLGALLRRLLLFAGGIVLLDLLYIGVLWLGRDWVVSQVLRKTLADRDALLLLWAAASLLALVRDLLQTALLVLERFRVLAALTAISAAVAIGSMSYAIGRWGALGAVVGQVVGEAVSLLGVLLLLLHARRQARRAGEPCGLPMG